MSARVRWGVLGAAGIAVRKVIPGMRASRRAEVVALASRDEARARTAANALGVPRAYGSYEALLADDEIDAVYIPLPNHLHVPWSIRAARAGKHVLCEKPLALSAAEARQLLPVQAETGVLIGEAFMVRTHPQWLEALRLVRSGRIGALRLVHVHFSYFKLDPSDIRNNAAYGGGALFDIGCYAVSMSRFLYGEEPLRIVAAIETDPTLQVDRLSSALLEFPSGQATFTCATQLVPHQRVELFGTSGRIEILRPFNAAPELRCPLIVHVPPDEPVIIETAAADQYAIQADRFSEAILDGGRPPVPLEDAIANMAALDAIFHSAATGRGVDVA